MWKKVILEAGTEEFGEELESALKKQNLTVKEFAERNDLSASTLYKITSGERVNFGVETLREIVDALQREEGYGGNTVGLITTRQACDKAPSSVEVDGVQYSIKLLPAHSIEEEIIKGINAEKDGVDGIICGPIAATTLEKVVEVPVGGLHFDRELIQDSLESFLRRV